MGLPDLFSVTSEITRRTGALSLTYSEENLRNWMM
jgi:hypothetical protein